ncbi:MAG: hypothetical protein HW389_764 [Bacteroidetes bacterium]|nr:hypothetical protein [Bacteroidota bacterium]
MRYYVAKFDFEAGEAGVPFIHGIEARDTDSAYKKVRRYMHTWYEREGPDEETQSRWAWYDKGVRVKLSEIVEVKDFESLWREMMTIK